MNELKKAKELIQQAIESMKSAELKSTLAKSILNLVSTKLTFSLNEIDAVIREEERETK
jgi:hypothetical protein